MSRYQASFYHFLISLGIFVVLAYLVLVQWYPDFFFAIDGGWEGMRIIIGVDLILGPLLTLVVFKAGKPGLKFDLMMIALIQGGALIAGTWIVYSERPTFFVYYDRAFYSSSGDTFERYGVPAPNPADFGDTTPVRVASVLPENPIEEADFRKILYQSRLPAWVYQRTYVPLADEMDDVIASGMDEATLRERDSEGNLDRWIAAEGGVFDDYAFLPIHSRYRSAFIGVRKSDRTLVDIVEISAPLSRESNEETSRDVIPAAGER